VLCCGYPAERSGNEPSRREIGSDSGTRAQEAKIFARDSSNGERRVLVMAVK
jgi:hypothetical protein